MHDDSNPEADPKNAVTQMAPLAERTPPSLAEGALAEGALAEGAVEEAASGPGVGSTRYLEADAAPIDLADTTGEPPAPRIDPYVGKTIDGRYFVECILGEGGMGIVYFGRHKVIDKKVAIKVLRGDMARDKEITERFLQEARAASSIGNPHIIDISDFGLLPDGSTYFVMEYLPGESLAALLDQQRPLPIGRLIPIAKQIAQGLSAAHGTGIVHRDLKPDNVMLVTRGAERDFVKILDFGIAKVGGEASRLTRAGSVFGTPHYMSPEQAAGAAVDLRTDIYALGVILYEMASGSVPFDADNFMGILTQHMYKAPVPVRALVPPPVDARDMPPGLDAVILKCLSKKPDLRYRTMDELIVDLEKVERGAMPDAVPEMMSRSGGFNVPADYFRGMPTPLPATPAGPRRRWGVYAGIAGVASAVAIVATILVRSATTTATPAPIAPAPVTAAAPATLETARVAGKQVLLTVEPTDATVTRDGADLGTVPIAIDVKPGETATLVIARSGYKTQSLVLDGTESKKLVRLAAMPAAPKAAPAGRPKAPAHPQQPSSSSIGEFKDPWR